MAARKKYQFYGRKEFFGSLIFDRNRGDYIPFDWDATFIFESSLRHSLDEIFSQLGGKLSRQSFDTFVQLCRSIELLDERGRFSGRYLDTTPLPRALSAPLRLHLGLTYECPLSCRYCGQDHHHHQADELTTPEIVGLLDQMADIGCFELALGGGEPFTHPDLAEIVHEARERELLVSLSTTAVSATRTQARKLAGDGIKQIRVSLDSSTEKMYDYLRGKGTYRRAIRGIKLLREIFPHTPLVVHTVFMKDNLGEVNHLLRLVQKLGAASWSIDFIRPIGLAATEPGLLLTNQEVADILVTIENLSRTTALPIRTPTIPRKSDQKGLVSGFGCTGGNLYCHVDPVGNVVPCTFLRKYFPAGNIRRQPLAEIWREGAGFVNFRQLKGDDTCQICDYYKSCRGACRARAALEGDPNAVDPYCFTRPQVAAPVAERFTI